MKIRDEIIAELKYNNLKQEDIELIKIRCIKFKLFDHTDKQYDYIGNNLNEVENIEYDEGYGHQELYGYIWMKDGSWFERCEYDGSESWRYIAVLGPRKDIELDEIIERY